MARAFSVNARILGLEEVRATLAALDGVPWRIVDGVLKDVAHEIGERAKALAPDAPEDNDYEATRRRGYVKLRESLTVYKHRRRKYWTVRFASRHAAAQHERMDYKHSRGQAKYLEQPFRAAKEGLLARLRSDVRIRMAEAATRRAKREARRQAA